MNEDKIAIIIPFINLNDYVLGCIEQCLRLNYSNFILVLLPDIDIELPSSLINNLRIKVLKTGVLTIAEKRNKGIEFAASSQYYAFLDSDAYPRPDWLKNAIEVFKGSENIWVVGGPSICPEKEEFKRRVASNALKSIFVSGLNAKNFRPERAQSRECKRMPACNLIVKWQAIEKIGMFNPAYITGEDLEFCKRISETGKKMIFSKDVIVYHHSRSIFMPFIKQRFVYSLSIPRISQDDFNILNLSYFFPLFFIISLIFLAAFSFYNHLAWSIIIYLGVIYFILILTESLRWSAFFFEVPLTFITIVIGNLIPAFGIGASLLNIKVNIKKLYYNYGS